MPVILEKIRLKCGIDSNPHSIAMSEILACGEVFSIAHARSTRRVATYWETVLPVCRRNTRPKWAGLNEATLATESRSSGASMFFKI